MFYLSVVGARYNFTPREQNVNFSKRPVKSKDWTFFYVFFFHFKHKGNYVSKL